MQKLLSRVVDVWARLDRSTCPSLHAIKIPVGAMHGALGRFHIFGYWKVHPWLTIVFDDMQRHQRGSLLTCLDQADNVFQWVALWMLICGLTSKTNISYRGPALCNLGADYLVLEASEHCRDLDLQIRVWGDNENCATQWLSAPLKICFCGSKKKQWWLLMELWWLRCWVELLWLGWEDQRYCASCWRPNGFPIAGTGVVAKSTPRGTMNGQEVSTHVER
jgi:hypothetical protein